MPSAKIATFIDVGSYAAIAAAYDVLMTWIRKQGLVPSEAPMYEFYLDGPNTPESEQRTKIVVPVRAQT